MTGRVRRRGGISRTRSAGAWLPAGLVVGVFLLAAVSPRAAAGLPAAAPAGGSGMPAGSGPAAYAAADPATRVPFAPAMATPTARPPSATPTRTPSPTPSPPPGPRPGGSQPTTPKPAAPKVTSTPSPTPSPTPTPTATPKAASTPAPTPAPTASPTPTPTPVRTASPPLPPPPAAAATPSPTPTSTPTPSPTATPTPPPAPAAGALTGLRVQGNQIVNGAGQTVRLRGVNRSGTEYMCIKGEGIFDGPSDLASVQAMKAWQVTVVRVPMNESCWLGINGAPAQYSGAPYRQALKTYVDLLTSQGMATILELHWSGAGTTSASGQQPMPNRDHTVTFWREVAAAFQDNSSVIFDLFNEPYPDSNRDTTAAWQCWRDGGTCPGTTFQAAGMQELVTVVRETGATNIIMLGGLRYANALSRWLASKPVDPLNNLAASWHVYSFTPCNTRACWDSELGPVASQVPLIAGEVGQDDCRNGFTTMVMDWLEGRGQHYLGWVWNVWRDGCYSISLISNYNGAPAGAYGQGFRDYLARAAAGQVGATPTVTPRRTSAGSSRIASASARTRRRAPWSGMALPARR